mmetsp:Transcript_6850/g.17086  ORF Transcript_6850/g.17086 Transcript_6850/m.17086 type:complete len:202 (-) Transcript_6850:112-717(-)
MRTRNTSWTRCRSKSSTRPQFLTAVTRRATATATATATAAATATATATARSRTTARRTARARTRAGAASRSPCGSVCSRTARAASTRSVTVRATTRSPLAASTCGVCARVSVRRSTVGAQRWWSRGTARWVSGCRYGASARGNDLVVQLNGEVPQIPSSKEDYGSDLYAACRTAVQLTLEPGGHWTREGAIAAWSPLFDGE